MAAHSRSFPWTSHYGHFDHFEGQMAKHDKVAHLTPHGNGVYELTRTRGDTLRIFICECYAFGVAEYMETVDKLGKIDAVIINSAWCGYTPEAKRHCRESNFGLFKIGELMGALHHDDYWRYLTKVEEEFFKKKGWL